jgi:hypothetical protein
MTAGDSKGRSYRDFQKSEQPRTVVVGVVAWNISFKWTLTTCSLSH